MFGQKCLRVIHFDARSLEVKVSADMVEFEDWIWDVAWLQVRRPTGLVSDDMLSSGPPWLN